MLMLIINAYPHLPVLLVARIQIYRIIMKEAVLREVLMYRSPSSRYTVRYEVFSFKYSINGIKIFLYIYRSSAE